MYSRETRRAALAAMDAWGGKPTREVSDRLGVPLTTLRRWAAEREANGGTSETPHSDTLVAPDASREELLSRIQDLELERDELQLKNTVLEHRVESLKRRAGM